MDTSLLDWKAEYSVSNEVLDAQHQKMFHLIRTLIQHFEQHTENEAIYSTFQQLTQYAIEHFDTEERMFEQTAYPNTQNHKQEHLKYRKTLDDLLAGWGMEKREKMMKNILEFVEEWWVTHIQGTDHGYIKYLNRES